MTCVVGVPGRIVADSRETGAIKRSCVKFFRPTGRGYLVGGAGASAPLAMLEHAVRWPVKLSLESLQRWVFNLHDPSYLDLEQIELLIVTRKEVYELEGRLVHPPSQLAAIGSGASWAQGYLEAKPSDLEGAIKAACKFDPWCAGPIRGVEL